MTTDASESLRQQFQLIQEQQQKKLLARKQRKTKNSDKTSRDDEEATTVESFWGHDGTSDHLDLKLDSKVLFGEEAPVHRELEDLKDTIRVLKDENGRLYKLLGERDEEMRILRKARAEEKKALAGTGVAADTAAGRIMELSKKNRELMADLESERNKVRQLMKKMREMEREMVSSGILQSNSKQPGEEQKSKSKSSDSEKDSSEVASLQDKLSQANNKVAEFRNQCDKLKKDLKVAHKVLAKEVGDGFNIATLLNDSSGWRGRQQQITSLQNKVTELKGQLNQVARGGSVTSNNIFLRSAMMSPSSAPSQYDEKHRSVLKKIEKDRKEAQEKTQAELESLDQEHTKLQQKHDAAKARNKVLASELKGLKAQVQTLLEKGAHDDELIAALMREQQQLKSAATKKDTSSSPKPVNNSEDKAQIEHLKLACQERDGRIQRIEEELSKARVALQNTNERYKELSERETKSVACGTEDLPTNEERLNNNTAPQEPVLKGPLLVNGFVEGGPHAERAEHVGLQNNSYMSHNRQGNPSQHHPEGPRRTQGYSVPGSPVRRHVMSRGSINGTPGRNSAHGNQLPPTPPSGGRGSRGRRNSVGGSDEIQLLKSQVHENKSLCQAAEVERDRLLELVTLLQKRVDDAKNSELEAINKWQQERRQVVHVEKQLSRVQSGQGVAKGRGKGYGSVGTGQERQGKPEDLDELATRLAIQTDENDALKEALSSTLKAKEEDLKFYQEMIDQTKKIFLQGLRQFRQNSAPS